MPIELLQAAYIYVLSGICNIKNVPGVPLERLRRWLTSAYEWNLCFGFELSQISVARDHYQFSVCR